MLPSQYIEKGWCQNHFAENAEGESVHEESDDAIAWCISAACIKSYRTLSITEDKYNELIYKVTYLIQKELNLTKDDISYNIHGNADISLLNINNIVVLYNDDIAREHNEVINLLKCAENEIGINYAT